MKMACKFCGSTMIEHEQYISGICNDEIECEHCHDRECSECSMNTGCTETVYECPFCAFHECDDARLFQTCDVCNNRHFKYGQCMCRRDPHVAERLKRTWPWQDDILRKRARANLIFELRRKYDV